VRVGTDGPGPDMNCVVPSRDRDHDPYDGVKCSADDRQSQGQLEECSASRRTEEESIETGEEAYGLHGLQQTITPKLQGRCRSECVSSTGEKGMVKIPETEGWASAPEQLLGRHHCVSDWLVLASPKLGYFASRVLASRAEPIEQDPRKLRIARADPELGRAGYVVVSAEAPGTKEILKVLSTYEILNPLPFQ
jgi:hypothetical protein